MKRLGRFEDGQLFTAAEKTLVVMLVAGVFGYWAGFNLSTPGVLVPFPAAAASARPAAATPPTRVAAPERATSVAVTSGARGVKTAADAAPREDPPAPMF